VILRSELHKLPNPIDTVRYVQQNRENMLVKVVVPSDTNSKSSCLVNTSLGALTKEKLNKPPRRYYQW
jgi:hypothetical protein